MTPGNASSFFWMAPEAPMVIITKFFDRGLLYPDTYKAQANAYMDMGLLLDDNPQVAFADVDQAAQGVQPPPDPVPRPWLGLYYPDGTLVTGQQYLYPIGGQPDPGTIEYFRGYAASLFVWQMYTLAVAQSTLHTSALGWTGRKPKGDS